MGKPGMPATPTQPKPCEWCGAMMGRKRYPPRNVLECLSNFRRRRFCSISCAASWQHANASTTAGASRKRANKLCGPECEACGISKNLEAHHVNGDPTDNTPSNIQTLCGHCHGFWHAMLKRSGRQPKTRMPRMI